MEKNPIEQLFDENDTDPVVLYNEQNEALAFEQIALIPYDGGIYAILRPVEPVDGMAEDEALVFTIIEDGDEELLTVVEDEAIITAVFNEYYKLLDEQV